MIYIRSIYIKFDDRALPVCLLLALTFVLCSAFFVLGDFQTINGDYFQYQMHADNLRSSQPWGKYLEGYPSVLPGWSLVLVLWQSTFGNGFFALGILNSILWAGTALIYAKILYRLRWGVFMRISVVAILLLSPYVISFQQEGQPNILAAFSIAAALWATYYFADNNMTNVGVELRNGKKFSWERLRDIGAGFLLLFASIVRVESVIFYIAAGLYFLMKRKWRVLVMPLIGIVVTLKLTDLLASWYGLGSNISWGREIIERNLKNSSGEGVGVVALLNDYLTYCLGILSQLVDVFLPVKMGETITFTTQNDYSHSIGILTVLITCLTATGFFKGETTKVTSSSDETSHVFWSFINRFLSPMRLTVIGTIAFWGLLGLSALPLRYLLPIAPMFLIFTLIGAGELLVFRKRINTVVTGLLFAIGIFVIGSNLGPYIDEPRRRNFVSTPTAKAMFSAIAEIAEENQQIGFWKPRIMMGELRKREALHQQVVGIRSPQLLMDLLDEDGVFAQIDPWMPDWMRDVLNEQTNICKLWTFESMSIYGPPNAQVQCIALGQ